MTNDIVARLRKGTVQHPRRWSGDTHHDLGGSVNEKETDRVMDEAAAEIERLRKELRIMRSIDYVIDNHGIAHKAVTIVYRDDGSDQ